MKVWHLCSNRWNSAITEYSLSSCRGLERAGVVNFFSPLRGSLCEKRSLNYGFRVYSFRSFLLSDLIHFFYLWFKIRPDRVIVYGGRETALCQISFLLFFFLPHPKVFRFRGATIEGDGAVLRLRQRLGLLGIAEVIVPSTSMMLNVTQFFSQPKTSVVPLGIDTEKFKRIDISSRVRFPRPRLLIFGRLDPIKGHRSAMEILRSLYLELGSDVVRPSLWIAGLEENVKKSELEIDAAQLGLSVGEDVVLDIGKFENTAQLMTSSVIGWVPSLGSEIICRVAQEFLACGTPVFVSGVGSLDETLVNPEAGLSYRGMSTEIAAQKLKALYLKSLSESEEVRQRRSEECRRLFSLEAMGEHLKVTFK